jgi:DNA-binding MarR family transcriptional regulator
MSTKQNTLPTQPRASGEIAADDPLLSKQEFEALAEFRYQLRRFLRFSENASRAEGLTPQQYLLLLHIAGFPGRSWATIGELAERLQAQPHGVVALVSRCEALQLVERRPSARDRRQVEVHILPVGELHLNKLAALHKAELHSLQGTFKVANITAFASQIRQEQEG